MVTHEFNLQTQNYKGIPLMLIARKDYDSKAAKRFTLNGTNQNVWIPNRHLETDGTIKLGENIDYVFFSAQSQLQHAGLELRWVPIERR